MTAAEWKFTTIIPDDEDGKASKKVCTEFHINGFSSDFPPPRDTVYAFQSGFLCGLAWAKAKYGIDI